MSSYIKDSMCNNKHLYFLLLEREMKIITSKNWEELGDISAPIDIRLAALLCDRCGTSLSLSIRWAAECSFMSFKNC